MYYIDTEGFTTLLKTTETTETETPCSNAIPSKRL